jgi:hypothetical protein
VARFGVRQTQKVSRLIGDILEIGETAALADQVEEIAMRAFCCIDPLSRATRRRIAQADEQGAARIVPDVADLPPGALAA